MKFDFGFYGHFMEGYKFNKTEKGFIQVQDKIQIYFGNAETTLHMYRKEFDKKIADQLIEKKHAVDRSEGEYQKYHDEATGSHHDRHLYAMHASGYDAIESNFAEADETIREHFRVMADHFNKSALVTFYALLESELRRLCAHLQTSFKIRVSLGRFEQSDYLQSIQEYLDLIIGFDTTELGRFVTKLKQLQYVRNKIMHNGAEFPLKPEEHLDNLVENSANSLYWEQLEDEQVKILRIRFGFLKPYYDLVSELFTQLFKLFNDRTQYVPLEKRVAYVFEFLASDLKATYRSHKAVKKGYQYIFQIKSEQVDNTFEFVCKISITEHSKDGVVFTPQLDEAPDHLDRLIDGLSNDISILKNVLAGYLVNGKAHQITFLLYPA